MPSERDDKNKKSYERRPAKPRSKESSKEKNSGSTRSKKTVRNPEKKQNIRRERHKKIEISVVAPLLNEEESLPELSLQLESELDKLVGSAYEVIYVDDGSKDGSFDIISRMHRRNPNFKAIQFRRNYGKAAALDAGFAAAKGEFVVTMDADLQDDPTEIRSLYEKMKEGWDLVSGWKKVRHDPWHKTVPSKLFNFVTSTTSGLRLHDYNCGLKMYRKDLVKSLKIYGEMHRYIPALAHWMGYRVTEIPVKHHPRIYGKSKYYGISRFMKGYLDLISVSFTNRYFKRPMHFFGGIGTMLSIIGIMINIFLTIQWFRGETDLTNRPLILLGIALIIVGVQLFSMGLIGEMIAKTFQEKNNYSIKSRI